MEYAYVQKTGVCIQHTSTYEQNTLLELESLPRCIYFIGQLKDRGDILTILIDF